MYVGTISCFRYGGKGHMANVCTAPAPIGDQSKLEIIIVLQVRQDVPHAIRLSRNCGTQHRSKLNFGNSSTNTSVNATSSMQYQKNKYTQIC